MKTICLLLIILVISKAAAPADNDASWQTVTKGIASDSTLANTANFTLKYAVDDQPVDHDLVHFILTGTSPGYMAFGIMNGHGMANIDIVSFEHSGGVITVTDRFSQGTTGAPADTDNLANYITFDSTNSSFDTSTNEWILRWSRRLETGDNTQDIPIYCDKNYAVVATSSSPTFGIHTLYQGFDLTIPVSAVGGCSAAPSGWTDWYDDHDHDHDDDEDQSSLLKISMFLVVLSFLII